MFKVSIIIPTLNESDNLPLLISDLSELDDISEILIIDANSSDKTEEISELYGVNFYQTNIRNRGYQLKYGANLAKGNWFLFLHADSRLDCNFINDIRSIGSKNKQLIYFFKFKVNNKKTIFRLMEFIVNIRSRIFKIPYGDQGLLIHRNAYKKIQFREIPLMEDIDFINRIKNKNLLKALKGCISTSSRNWDSINLIKQSFKNWRLRRRWLRGDPLASIYDEYYDS